MDVLEIIRCGGVIMIRKIILIMMSLASIASAESILIDSGLFGTYNVSFEYNKPHEINFSDGSATVNSSDGKFDISPGMYSYWGLGGI